MVEEVVLAPRVSIAVPVTHGVTQGQHAGEVFGMNDRFDGLFIGRTGGRGVHGYGKIEKMVPGVVLTMGAFFKSPAIGLGDQGVSAIELESLVQVLKACPVGSVFEVVVDFMEVPIGILRKPRTDIITVYLLYVFVESSLAVHNGTHIFLTGVLQTQLTVEPIRGTFLQVSPAFHTV